MADIDFNKLKNEARVEDEKRQRKLQAQAVDDPFIAEMKASEAKGDLPDVRVRPGSSRETHVVSSPVGGETPAQAHESWGKKGDAAKAAQEAAFFGPDTDLYLRKGALNKDHDEEGWGAETKKGWLVQGLDDLGLVNLKTHGAHFSSNVPDIGGASRLLERIVTGHVQLRDPDAQRAAEALYKRMNTDLGTRAWSGQLRSGELADHMGEDSAESQADVAKEFPLKGRVGGESR